MGKNLFFFSFFLQLNYTNWKPGQPDLETEDCVGMKVKDGQWDNHRCSRKNPYICQQKPREYHDKDRYYTGMCFVQLQNVYIRAFQPAALEAISCGPRSQIGYV